MKNDVRNREYQEETFFTDLEFLHRLKLARMYAGYDDPREFANAAGISSSSYYQYESGRSKSAQNQETLDKLSKASGISADWLETGRGYPVNNKPDSYDALDALAKKVQLKPYQELDAELLQIILTQLLSHTKNRKLSAEVIATIAIKTYQRLSIMRLPRPALLQVIATTLNLVLELYQGDLK